jgi:hypothetical protein
MVKLLIFYNCSFALKRLFHVNGKATVWHTPSSSMCLCNGPESENSLPLSLQSFNSVQSNLAVAAQFISQRDLCHERGGIMSTQIPTIYAGSAALCICFLAPPQPCTQMTNFHYSIFKTLSVHTNWTSPNLVVHKMWALFASK